MHRSLFIAAVLCAGSLSGIVGVYALQADTLKTLRTGAALPVPEQPSLFRQDGTLRNVNMLNKTLAIDLTSPYDTAKTISIVAQYDAATTFFNKNAHTIDVTSLHEGDRLSVSLLRKSGPLYVTFVSQF